MTSVRVLGIDPGSRMTGFGLVEFAGSRSVHVVSGVIEVAGDGVAERLQHIFAGVSEVIEAHQPDEFAIEQVFMHKNAQSALKLGQARGAALVAAACAGLPVFEYTATRIKQSTTGRGHADKAQIQHMVKVLLSLGQIPRTDEADALAAALCHGHTRETNVRMARSQSLDGSEPSANEALQLYRTSARRSRGRRR